MKKIIVAVCAAALLAFSMALVGCGGGVSDKDKEAFVGTWELESTTDNDLNDMIKLLDQYGQKLTVELTSDGKMKSEALGEGTWELSSATEGKIKQSDGNLKLKMADGKLVIEGGDGSMTFVKAQ